MSRVSDKIYPKPRPQGNEDPHSHVDMGILDGGSKHAKGLRQDPGENSVRGLGENLGGEQRKEEPWNEDLRFHCGREEAWRTGVHDGENMVGPASQETTTAVQHQASLILTLSRKNHQQKDQQVPNSQPRDEQPSTVLARVKILYRLLCYQTIETRDPKEIRIPLGVSWCKKEKAEAWCQPEREPVSWKESTQSDTLSDPLARESGAQTMKK